MFDALTDRIEGIFSKIRSRGKLTEDLVDEVLREVRLALLEADVHTAVAREFVKRVRHRAIGDEVMKALTPAQQVVKIVNEELVSILGSRNAPLNTSPKPPTIVMMAGLQGSGKTTAAAKLALMLKNKGKRPLLVACDLRRPAAIEQLQQLGERIGVPVLARTDLGPIEVAAEGLAEAERRLNNVVIVDTAGRLSVDEEMMAEAAAIKERIRPHEILFVCDAMTGQDAVNVALAFAERVDFTGIVLSKLDGDARGGAALSITHVTERPVKFASTGEDLEAFEQFHPDRIASRILGMGDLLTLIEKSEEEFEEQERIEMQEKMRKAEFTLDDFLKQMKRLRKMGSLTSLVGMLPGARNLLKDVEIDDKDVRQLEAIIHSMTTEERQDPKILNNGRRQRIARGCGRTVNEVNQLVKQFDQAKQMMRMMAGGGPASIPHGVSPAGIAGGGGSGPHRPKPKRQSKPKQHHKNKKKKRR